MDKFNNQFATQRLREEDYTIDEISEMTSDSDKQFKIDYKKRTDPKFYELFNKAVGDNRQNFDYSKSLKGSIRITQDGEWRAAFDNMNDTAEKDALDWLSRNVDNRQNEESATGAGANFVSGEGEQYATTKAFKKEEKDVEHKLAAGKAKIYAKDKWGWKEAPSIPNRPSKGGFLYKQIFEEEMNEDTLEEAQVPSNIKKWATQRGIIKDVNTIARWAEKAGTRIRGGTAIGKGYDTLVLDTLEEESAIYFDTYTGNITVNRKPVSDYKSFVAALDLKPKEEPSIPVNENYSKFKTETKTRTKDQQLHSAMKLAEKKIKEANKILEYTAQLKTELNETKVGKHTEKVMERITRNIAEAYGKMKKLK